MDNLHTDVHNALNNLSIPRAVINSALVDGKLNICHINVQSLCARNFSKFEELKRTIENSKLDVVCFTETWLNDTISDRMICLNGFKLIRNDRNRHGGGICVFIRSNLSCRVVCKSSVSDSQSTLQRTEFLILEVVVGDHCLLLAVYYNPPDVDCADILEKNT